MQKIQKIYRNNIENQFLLFFYIIFTFFLYFLIFPCARAWPSQEIMKILKDHETHENYDGSMFSEFELIGQSNYILNSKIQKPILFLRLNLDGKLKNWQKKITEKLNYKHVTYEHMHKGKKNKGMLSRQQSTIGFLRIILRDFMIFYIKSIFHYFNFLRLK